MNIITTKESETPLVFDYLKGQNEVLITLLNEINSNTNFSKYSLEIQKKYKKQKITLIDWGLRKSIKWKIWKNMTELEIVNCINELNEVARLENLKIYKRD